LKVIEQFLVGDTFAIGAEIGEMATPLFKRSTITRHYCISRTVRPRRLCDHSKCSQ